MWSRTEQQKQFRDHMVAAHPHYRDQDPLVNPVWGRLSAVLRMLGKHRARPWCIENDEVKGIGATLSRIDDSTGTKSHMFVGFPFGNLHRVDMSILNGYDLVIKQQAIYPFGFDTMFEKTLLYCRAKDQGAMSVSIRQGPFGPESVSGKLSRKTIDGNQPVTFSFDASSCGVFYRGCTDFGSIQLAEPEIGMRLDRWRRKEAQRVLQQIAFGITSA